MTGAPARAPVRAPARAAERRRAQARHRPLHGPPHGEAQTRAQAQAHGHPHAQAHGQPHGQPQPNAQAPARSHPRHVRRLAAAAACCAALVAATPAQTVKTIQLSGPVDNRYDIVILGDGYTAAEEAKFDADAAAALNHLLGKPAYAAYRAFFNAHTVFRASAESGATHPDVEPPIFRNTAYGATYNSGGVPRCLYITKTSQAIADARLAPDVEGRVMVLVNDTRYGGCAGTFSVSYTGPSGPEVQAHEFGHSFAGLADEYDYGASGTYSGPEPPQANITAESTGQLKWPLWLGTLGVSAYQGAGQYATGLWRPKLDCMMRSLGAPLCPVCDEQVVLSAYFAVDPIEDPMPATSRVTAPRGAALAFSFTDLVPGGGAIEWVVDGAPAATGSTTFTWDTSGAASGAHFVLLAVRDTTALVRNDPSSLLESRRSWLVDLESPNPGAFATYGSGCRGSATEPLTCLAVNEGGTYLGFPALAGVTYALAVTAPADLVVEGFELLTASAQAGSVAVRAALYAAGPTGQPEAEVRAGSMLVGQAVAWYRAELASTYTVAAGATFFLAFTVPPSPIRTSIVLGAEVPYVVNTGPGGAWTAPIRNTAWAYRVLCAGTAGEVPVLTANGVPEIGRPFHVSLQRALPSSAAVLLLGASNATWQGAGLPLNLAPWGAPACALLASAEAAVPAATNGAGQAAVALAVPLSPALVGGRFYTQFAVADRAANALGLAWTHGGAATLGEP